MILKTEKGESVNTAFASKQSRISIKIFEAHTSVLVPFMVLPVAPFWITVKICFWVVLALVLLERKGWTVSYTLKRLRRYFAGSYRTKHTRRKLARLAKY
ncbi:hypothetical protein [Pseudomonas sp. UMAB-40]|uniref:hypothetical protein n=1 Tax=Pseudomonas sp. UMAB-40 TaxID=1365407 RepID=UPI001C59B80C|nr:hypothetical protein [Pseudomonas sp. UMAB-40]